MSKSKLSKPEKPQPESSYRVELKYCENCGCLLTRDIGSGLNFCIFCESKYSAENSYLTHPKRRPYTRSPRPARLPIKIDLKACAETAIYPEMEECA